MIPYLHNVIFKVNKFLGSLSGLVLDHVIAAIQAYCVQRCIRVWHALPHKALERLALTMTVTVHLG